MAYGAVGLFLVAVLAASVAPALATVDTITRSASDIERTLLTTRDAFDAFGSSLIEGKVSAQQAAATARSTAATAKQLADAMSINIFGAQPLLGLATGFRRQSTDLDALARDVDALADALARDESQVRAVQDQIALLHGRTVAIAAGPATSIPLAPVLYTLLAWIAAQAAAAFGLGLWLWRSDRR
jgi:hypothetical protein